MGLKTTNYKKKSGAVLETAYARIEEVIVRRDISTAKFHINTSREALDNYGADEVISFNFPTDLTRNQYEVAYQKAKEPFIQKVINTVENIIGYDDFGIPIKDYNYIEKQIEVPNIFTGWEDDII